MTEKCPNAKKYGERVCIGGYMWELTYSEMGPPDSRQNTGDRCPYCMKREGEALSHRFNGGQKVSGA